jgi:hypothetical protein
MAIASVLTMYTLIMCADIREQLRFHEDDE